MKCLIMVKNKFKQVPMELFMLAHLEKLSMAHNAIKAIEIKSPAIVAELKGKLCK